eukprot:7922311-Pyramimonas_sp.AAC.1
MSVAPPSLNMSAVAVIAPTAAAPSRPICARERAHISIGATETGERWNAPRRERGKCQCWGKQARG